MALAKLAASPAPAPVEDGAASVEPDPLQRPFDPSAAAIRSQTVYGDVGQSAGQAYHPSTQFAQPDTREARSGKLSSFRPPGDGTDTLRGAQGFLATDEGGDRLPRRRQETSWHQERRICVAA